MEKETIEIWKSIPDFDGYEVSNTGQVRSSYKHFGKKGWGISDKPVKILKPHCDHRGYRSVNLRRDGKTYRRRIGNLVLLAFIGLKPDGMEVCHNDGNPSDDCFDNLRYDTHKANIGDAIKHGTMRCDGERSNSAKLTNAQVKAIREQYASGNISHRALARKYQVNQSSISDIVTGKSYRKAGGPITLSQGKLTDDEVNSIRKQRARGDSLKEIANRFGVSKSCVSLIARDKRH